MQNKPKAELNAALMLLDTRSMSFDMREIDNRRFMFSPQAGELILGRQYRGGQLYKSHAEEHFDSGAKAPFDSFIRGWIGTGRDYPDGVIHFSPNIGTDNITAFDNAFSTLQMFSENGAAGDTVVRGFGRKWEQPLKDIITPTKERSKTVSEQEKNYSSYDFDRLEVAKKLVIERSIYFESEKADISALTGLSLAELTRLRQESAAAEQAVFDRLKTEATAWEQQAGNTRFLEKAIEYVQTPPVKHKRHTRNGRVQFDVGQIPGIDPDFLRKFSAGDTQLFTGCFYISAKSFKAGALLNFCHVFITSQHCIVHQ